MPESRRKEAKDSFRGDKPLIGILQVFQFDGSWGFILIDVLRFRSDGVGDADADGAYVFVLYLM